MLSIEEERHDSILSRVSESYFSIRTYSVRQCADMYKGCQFDCAYCFAASYKREKLVEQQEFGTRIKVYVNGALKLGQELGALTQESRSPQFSEYTCLGVAADSYQPVERKYKLTRECLKVFLETGLPVTILTKSNLCERDIDLWSQLAERDLAAIGFTLTMPTGIEPSIKHILEPFSPSTSTMLRTLELFVKAGVKTYVFVDPVIPFVTDEDHKLSQLFREIANTGNKKVHFGVLKLTPATWRRLKSRLFLYNEQVIPLIEDIYFRRGSVEFGDSWLPHVDYQYQLYQYAKSECQSVDLGFSGEGRDYDLWLDDWATVQDPYRYPTGYNLWEIIKQHNGSFVTLPDAIDELQTRFMVLTPSFVKKLSELWRDKRLFFDLSDIAWTEKNNSVVYYYNAGKHVTENLPSIIA